MMDSRFRTERLRESLHVQVSAAVASMDEGKTFQDLDRRLASAAKPAAAPTQAEIREPAKPVQLNELQVAAIETDAVADAVAMMGAMGGTRGRRTRNQA